MPSSVGKAVSSGSVRRRRQSRAIHGRPFSRACTRRLTTWMCITRGRKSAGARIAIPPYDTHYGSREYSAWDVQGHLWGFGTYPMGSPSGEPRIFPELSYRHEPDAVGWLTTAFGLHPAVQIQGPNGKLLHVEMRLGDSTVMLNLGDSPSSKDGLTQAISVRVDDPDALFAGARKKGPSWCRRPRRRTTGRGAAGCAISRAFSGDSAHIARNSDDSAGCQVMP